MANCMVDVEPQSLFGIPCNRLLRPGVGCPVHGFETEPAVLKRESPDPKVIEAALTKIIEEI